MKTAYENNKYFLGKVIPSMSYDGGDIKTWQKSAKAKLSELLGIEKFCKVDADFNIEFENKLIIKNKK